jgi:uncharacterized protein YbjT (DUF2867 family)
LTTQSGEEPSAARVRFDFTDASTFDAALADVDRVFLMRPPHLGKPEDLYPFLDELARRPIRLVVFLSLMGIDKNTIPPHYRIEKRLREIGVPWSFVRPGFFMQNLTGVHLHEIREESEIYIPAGKSKCSFIDAADIGLAAATLLHEPEKYVDSTFTLTGPEALDYQEIARILSDVTGRPIRYAKPGLLAYRQRYIHRRGLPAEYVNVTVALYVMTRLGTANAITDEFYQLTGRQPRTFRNFAEAHKALFDVPK